MNGGRHPPRAISIEPGSCPRSGYSLLAAAPRCVHCLDEGHVCEDHPEMPWEGIWGTVEGHAAHGGLGMPCPACCAPIPEDGTHPIGEAFIPDWMREPA